MTEAQKARLDWLSGDRHLSSEQIREWADLKLLTLTGSELRALGELASWL